MRTSGPAIRNLKPLFSYLNQRHFKIRRCGYHITIPFRVGIKIRKYLLAPSLSVRAAWQVTPVDATSFNLRKRCGKSRLPSRGRDESATPISLDTRQCSA
jgi:hypothetical protein